jgi:hypothetical protein
MRLVKIAKECKTTERKQASDTKENSARSLATRWERSRL